MPSSLSAPLYQNPRSSFRRTAILCLAKQWQTAYLYFLTRSQQDSHQNTKEAKMGQPDPKRLHSTTGSTTPKPSEKRHGKKESKQKPVPYAAFIEPSQKPRPQVCPANPSQRSRLIRIPVPKTCQAAHLTHSFKIVEGGGYKEEKWRTLEYIAKASFNSTTSTGAITLNGNTKRG